jgi:hypothetical protein
MPLLLKPFRWAKRNNVRESLFVRGETSGRFANYRLEACGSLNQSKRGIILIETISLRVKKCQDCIMFSGCTSIELWDKTCKKTNNLHFLCHQILNCYVFVKLIKST